MQQARRKSINLEIIWILYFRLIKRIMDDDVFCCSSEKVFTTFTKDVRWSPDGSCILTADDGNSLRLFEVPGEPTNSWIPVLEGRYCLTFV